MRADLKLFVVFSVLACVGVLSGCGPWQSSVETAASGPPGPPANLNGDWLISGSLPSLPSTAQQNGVLNFAATLSVSNSQVTGAGSFSYPCGGLVAAFGFAISGVVDSSGTFTAEVASPSLQQDGVSLTFSGTVPSQDGGVWSGTYTYVNPGCPQTLSGSFTSTPLGTLTGTYTGSTSLSPGYGSGTPVSITLQLTQGGNVTLPGGASGYSADTLSGTIAVTGSTCFHSGTIASSNRYQYAVSGNYVDLPFTMDDGSLFDLTGTFTDIAANTISISSGAVSSGACASNRTGTLTLQR